MPRDLALSLNEQHHVTSYESRPVTQADTWDQQACAPWPGGEFVEWSILLLVVVDLVWQGFGYKRLMGYGVPE